MVLSWSGHWGPLQADFWVLFDTFHHVLSTSLAFWYNTMFQAYFVLPLPRINHLFHQWVLVESGIQKLKVLLLENCCSSSCSSGRTRECIYLSTHTHIKSIVTSLFDKYLVKMPSPRWHLQFQYYRIHSSFLPFNICNFHLWQWETSLLKPHSHYIIWCIYLFNQSPVCNKYPNSATVCLPAEMSSHSNLVLIPHNGHTHMLGYTSHPIWAHAWFVPCRVTLLNLIRALRLQD